jgi:hypothetical protein
MIESARSGAPKNATTPVLRIRSDDIESRSDE